MCTEYMWDVIDTHHISILMLGNLLFASCMQAQIDADNNFLWKSMPQPHHAALTKAHFVYLVMCCSDLQQTDNCKSNHIHQPINKQDPSHSQHLYVWSDFLKIQVVTRNFENYWWQLTTIEYITHQFWSPKSTSVFNFVRRRFCRLPTAASMGCSAASHVADESPRTFHGAKVRDSSRCHNMWAMSDKTVSYHRVTQNTFVFRCYNAYKATCYWRW